jgi:phenylalanyl-tRNA synthetase beta chain
MCSLISGDIVKEKINIYPVKNRVKVRTIKFNIDLIKKIIGLEIPLNQIISILKSLGIKVIKKTAKSLDLSIPTNRPDILQEIDIIEELIRVYGLARIKSNLPAYPITIPKRNENIYWESHIRNILKELGFFETYNYSFINRKDGSGLENLIELENPVSEDFKYLRPNLIFNLLKFVGPNLKIKQIQGKKADDYLQLFEIGNIFSNTKKGIEEKRMLSCIVWSEKEKNGFLCAKSLLETLLDSLGISNHYLDVDQNSSADLWNKSKTAEINIDGNTIGYFGEISLKTLNNFNTPQCVFAFDIDIERLIKECNEDNEFEEIPKFPAAIRDISILLPKEARIAKVLKILNEIGDNLKDIDLLDMYEGKEMPEGKKNLTFRLIFQARDKTMSGQEIDITMQKIIKELEKNPAWEIRK